MAVFIANQGLNISFPCMCQISDRADSGLGQLLFGRFAEKQKLAYRKRPHLRRDFFWKQGMHFVRFFEIGRHFGQEFIGGNADIYRKSQLVGNPVFNFMCCRDRIRVQKRGSRHIKEHFVNRERLHDRSVGCADFLEGPGALDIKIEITGNNNHIRAFPQCHCHRLAGLDTAFFRRNRLCYNDTRPFCRITADAGGNVPQIRQPLFHPPCGLPG